MMIDLRQIKGGLALKQLVDQLNTSYDAAKVLIDGGENVKAAVERLTTGLAEANAAIDTKAEQSYVDGELAKKADKTQVAIDIADAVQASRTEVDAELAKKATKVELTEGLATKSDIGHGHSHTEITGLGTAAVLNVGTQAGNVVKVENDGKIATSILPSLAVNETFVVKSKEEALALPNAEVGDIVIINPDVATLEAEGSIVGTFILVDLSKELFEERFRPLQSISDSVSKAELNKALALKADKTQVANDIATAKSEAIAEAERLSGEVQSSLDEYKISNDAAVANHEGRIVVLETEMPKKADKTQVATDIADAKAEAIADAEGKIEAAKTELNGVINTVKGELETSIGEVDAKADSNKAEIDEIREEIANNIAATLVEKEYEIKVSSDNETTFTLIEEPSAERPVKVFVNGVKYKVGAGKDFTLTGRELVWNAVDFQLGQGFVIEVVYYATV